MAVQTITGLPLRLRVLPFLRDIEEDNRSVSNIWSSRFLKYLRFLGRLAFSQLGTKNFIYISHLSVNLKNRLFDNLSRRSSVVSRDLDISRRGGFLRYGRTSRT